MGMIKDKIEELKEIASQCSKDPTAPCHPSEKNRLCEGCEHNKGRKR